MDGSFAKYVTWTGGYIFMYPSPRRSSLEGTTKDHDVRMNDVMFGLFAHWTVRMTPQVPRPTRQNPSLLLGVDVTRRCYSPILASRCLNSLCPSGRCGLRIERAPNRMLHHL